MLVTVYHNVARSAGQDIGFLGHQQGHPVVPVFSCHAEEPSGPGGFLGIVEATYRVLNAGPDLLSGEERCLALRYRALDLRRPRTGDVIQAGDIAFALEPGGFRKIAGELAIVPPPADDKALLPAERMNSRCAPTTC